jgi:hypothetical protein
MPLPNHSLLVAKLIPKYQFSENYFLVKNKQVFRPMRGDRRGIGPEISV